MHHVCFGDEQEVNTIFVTAIYDNVAKALGKVGKMVEEAKMKGTPYASVSVMIFTDGEDNDSRNHTSITNKALVAMTKSQGWNVVYLGGGGQNAEHVGVERLGVERGQCLTFDSANRKATMAALNAASDQVVRYSTVRPSAFVTWRGFQGHRESIFFFFPKCILAY